MMPNPPRRRSGGRGVRSGAGDFGGGAPGSRLGPGTFGFLGRGGFCRVCVMGAACSIFVHRLREHIPNLTLSPPAHYIRVCLTVSRIRSDRRRNPVIEMTASASFSYLTPQFDDFLFARIDEDGEATPLSVLSVLARLGVDPWEEAAKLAQLPRISAAERLAAFIAATPGRRAYLNAKTVRDRLIDLLPSPAGVPIPPGVQRGGLALAKSRWRFIWPVIIAVLLAIQVTAISRQPAGEPHAASTSTVLP